MIVIFAIAAVIALSSTIIVHPWFWIGIFKRHTIIADSENSGVVEGKCHDVIVTQIVSALFVFIIVIVFYKVLHIGICVTESISLLVFPLGQQVLSILCDKKYSIKNSGLKIIVLIILFFISYFFPIIARDVNKSFVEEQKIRSNTTAVEDENIPDRVTLASLFEFDSVEKPYYSNGKYIYKVPKNSFGDGCKGIIIIKEHENTAKYIPCSFDASPLPKEIREKHPYEVIVPGDVVVSDKDNIYQKYVIIERENIFGKLKITKYILQKLNGGNEITEYTTVSELPKFAR